MLESFPISKMWRSAGINSDTRAPFDLPNALRNIKRDVQDFGCIGQFISKEDSLKDKVGKRKNGKFLLIEIESTTKKRIKTLVYLDQGTQHVIFKKTSDYQFFLQSPWYQIKKIIEKRL